jgi:glutamine cyclotransferase
MMRRTLPLIALVGVACDGGDGHARADAARAAPPSGAPTRPTSTAPAPSAGPTIPRRERVEVVRSLPHDPDAFTQGLVFHGGRLFESTGLNGRSSLRKVDVSTGRVLQQRALPAEIFAEGLARFDGRLFQLSWQNGKGFVWDAETFEPVREWRYTGEGWGLTHDGTHLIQSDGTATLRFLDPRTLETVRTLEVRSEGRLVTRLNELEWVEGELLANVWMTDRIAVIDPTTGNVTAWIDLVGLLPASERRPETDVLNGIAYDAANGRLYVTGKLWPRLFEVRRVPAP